MAFTTIRKVAEAVAREIGAEPPQHAQHYPYRYDKALGGFGMSHRGSGRGEERRYWVKLTDGREFLGTKAQLFDWAAMHLQQPQEVEA